MASARILAVVSILACIAVAAQAETPTATTRAAQPAKEAAAMSARYVEIVSEEMDALIGLYAGMHGLDFGPPVAEMGQARIATREDGTVLGIRKPLAAHETPIMRTYLGVADIAQAVKAAEAAGAMVAYPPTKQGEWGTFAIVIHGGVQHGLWQK